ncbi:MAG: tRNA (N6-isopentenyl adenosine(37)-C2)-methylthiotransferase MiaB [Desulfobulbaceae bacterium]|nr:tRNA (N6-isopentenyl adenosine(37)-C2)-methylthiotransferase MiaB [Desulfobulbaceae bacterium]
MNERDSEIIEQLLFPLGFIPVADMQTADLVILNTCSVRAKAEQKVYSLLGQIRQYKSRNPGMLVAVAGCVAQQEKERIMQRMPHVNMVIGTRQIYKIPAMITRIDAGQTNLKPEVDLDDTMQVQPFLQVGRNGSQSSPSPAPGEYKKFVTIMQGCNNFCSYCVVPLTRGREVSRPVADILDEVRLLVEQGVKEITLLGQNVNSYGLTNPVADDPVNFAALLRLVSATPGLNRLRFTTSNPKDLSDDLMRCFAELENLCPQFHLPVQSGSNRILSLMNRKYTVEEYLQKVEALRRYRPDIALGTDMIIGFPGETEEDFAATMRLLETVRFHGSFSFKYSDRPGTRAASLGNPVNEEVKSERLSRFQDRQDEISLARNREYLDHILEVIVEGKGKKGLWQGRSSTNHIVHFSPVRSQEPHRGDAVMVRIDKAGQHSLAGTHIQEGDES